MILTALMLSAASPPPTSADRATFEIRCIIVTGELLESRDAAVRQTAMLAGLFYFGRLDARFPEAELEARMLQEFQTMRAEDVPATRRACGEFMQSRSQWLIDVSDRLEAREGAAEIR